MPDDCMKTLLTIFFLLLFGLAIVAEHNLLLLKFNIYTTISAEDNEAKDEKKVEEISLKYIFHTNNQQAKSAAASSTFFIHYINNLPAGHLIKAFTPPDIFNH
jgi:hypothetical protein